MLIIPISVTEKNLMPYKKHIEDAGWDLRSSEDITLYPGEEYKIDTGVKMAIPDGHVGLVFPRSGLGSDGLILRNTVGVIDNLYRGTIFCKVKNFSDTPMIISRYERFAQIVILPVPITKLKVVDSLDSTNRGEAGFGDSGKL